MTSSVLIPVLYLSVLVAAGIIQLWSLRNRDRLAPFGVLVHRIMHYRITRIAVIFTWWWLGWHFVVA